MENKQFLTKFCPTSKQGETVRNINHVFGPGLTSERTVELQFQDVCGKNKSLIDKGSPGPDFVISNDKLIALGAAYNRTTLKEIPAELRADLKVSLSLTN